MAAPPPVLRLARGLLRALGVILAGVVAALVLFGIAGWIGSSIPRNADWQEADRGITVMVETNGVHTSLVVPLVTFEKDWRPDFPATDIAASDRPYTHLSIGWGEHVVFLETPTWWDLSPLTVLRIIVAGGSGLLHVAHYVDPGPSDTLRPLTLSRAEYQSLVAEIESWILPEPRMRYDGYGRQDAFYQAPGHYSAVNTSNQWTSDVLAAAGVRTGWWTPFSGGVMKWVPPLPDGTPAD